MSISQKIVPGYRSHRTRFLPEEKDGALLGKASMCECGFRKAHFARPQKKLTRTKPLSSSVTLIAEITSHH